MVNDDVEMEPQVTSVTWFYRYCKYLEELRLGTYPLQSGRKAALATKGVFQKKLMAITEFVLC